MPKVRRFLMNVPAYCCVYLCGNKGVVVRDGRHFCAEHDPLAREKA